MPGGGRSRCAIDTDRDRSRAAAPRSTRVRLDPAPAGEPAHAEPKTLRYRLLHVAARLTRRQPAPAAHRPTPALGPRPRCRFRSPHRAPDPALLAPDPPSRQPVGAPGAPHAGQRRTTTLGRPQLKIDPALVDHSSALTDNRSWRRFRRGSEGRVPEKGPLGSCAAPRRLPCLTGSPRPSRIAAARPRPHGVGADVSRMSPTSSRTGNAHADKPCSGTPATGR